MSEIITLQIGHYSNFIGTHWWNIQERGFCYDPAATEITEVNPNITFREGLSKKGDVTFTPRLISVDLGGSLKSLKVEGNLYNSPDADDHKFSWDRKVEVHKAPVDEKNEFLKELHSEEDIAEDEDKDLCSISNSISKDKKTPCFYNLDDKVQVWSDFLRIHLHPKSLFIVKDYLHSTCDESFKVFGCGKNLFTTERHCDELEDRVRYFAEECDLLQGFHFMFDIHNGFAGLGSEMLRYLDDEFPTKTLFAIPSVPAQADFSDEYHVLNMLLSHGSLLESSSIFCPVSLLDNVGRRIGNPINLPGLSYKPGLAYHTSAIIASALDTVTLPYRCRLPKMSLHDLQRLSVCGRKMSSLSLSMPFNDNKMESSVTNLIKADDEQILRSLTPGVHSFQPSLAQHISLRGRDNLLSRVEPSCNRRSKCDTVKQYIEERLQSVMPQCSSSVCVTKDELLIDAPYPNIVDAVTSARQQNINGAIGIKSIAGLHPTRSCSGFMNRLAEDAVRSYAKLQHKYAETGLERDDYIDILHRIKSTAESYSV